MIYEFITTGDEITFSAENDHIAFACTIMVSQGTASCKRYEQEKEIDLDAMVSNVTDPNRGIESRLEMSLDKFVKKNHPEMVKCFQSFAYGTIEKRSQYDDAIAALKDPKERLEFKTKHENDNRTSLTAWVIIAWELGEATAKKFK